LCAGSFLLYTVHVLAFACPTGGFIAPCLPTTAPHPPSGDQWLHEIEHDGFRVVGRRVGMRVKLYSRPGNDLTYRFPLIVEALARLRLRSWIIDGEAPPRPCWSMTPEDLPSAPHQR
jgi:ATP-dependent DNA ligase